MGGRLRKFSKIRRILEPIVKEFSPAKAEVALIRSEMNGHYFFTDRIGGARAQFFLTARKLGREYETPGLK